MKRTLLCVVVVIACFHFGFMFLEAFAWSTQFVRSLTHLSESAARETVGVGRNMALSNGFLGVALLWATFALREREAYSAQWVLLSFIVVAGVVGAVTMRNYRIFVMQSLPALVALGMSWLARPYARTEDQAIQQIIEIERQILAINAMNPRAIPETAKGAVPRGQHPKLLGLVEAKLIVADNLPKEMRVGVFKEPGKSYDAWIRYSNARNLDDRDPGGHGMAIKLFNVAAETESSNVTQDFVLFDSPVFFVGNPLQYVEFEEATLRAHGKSRSETRIAFLLNYYWRHRKQLKNLRNAQRSDVIDPLAIRYWSMTPYQFGSAVVKYSAKPVGEGAVPVVVERSKDMLREAMKVRLGRTDAEFVEFEFQVQVQTDARSMPVEDPTKEWDEAVSRPITVAHLRIPTRQPFDTEERNLIAENLSFTPWHALHGHRPLGGINRVRQAVYESLSEFRHALNHVPRQEPNPPTQAR
ncbi:DUF1304 family protein [Singulisphaera acidiphila]|uniref:Putative membrane protein n=1 Tax=Singulisphaera acidiphila (strain ATCC BAA-1392 / DSM 18658 / VKM B-2454 / MOB10) TaxID=886293 RepID=L0DH53_SINAD|nr:DUF1304 family protein [Singulisphaera acidiphila]AGA28185.1 putative membrane protein [Singulisphaera acidiphila DSM 18658]